MKIDYAEIQEQIRLARSEAGGASWQMDPAQLVALSAEGVAQAIRARQITSVETVVAFLQQICARNPGLNAIVTIDAKAALQRAREADRALAAGTNWGPLHGVPFTIKDTFQTRGLRTTAGYPPLASFVPQENAVLVQRLLDAGAILMGKSNTPALAMDMQTTNPLFGTTNNLHDPAWTAGGSSGGSAVAVGAGMTPFEFGTDLGGSIRVPAAFNGVPGLRPTFGLVSMRGHVPPRPGEIDGVRRMATAGPIARHLSDLAMLLNIVAGPGNGDHRLAPLPPAAGHALSMSELRIAWADSVGGVPVATEIKEAMSGWVQKLARAGASVTQAEPANFPYETAWETWGSIVGAQGGYDKSNLVRSMGRFFTKRMLAASPMQRNIVGPITVPGYMAALTMQDECIERLETFLDDFDVWLVPVSSTTAFAHQAPSRTMGDFSVYDQPVMVDGVPVPYYVATQSCATIFSLTESPVLSLPIGRDKKGAPIGIQLVGRRFADHKLLQIAQACEAATK